MNKNKPIKVILLGESGVGKTNIIKRFKYNEFNESSSSTKGASYNSKTLDIPYLERSIKFDIYDMGGHEKYHSLSKAIYKGAKIVILVYDITNEYSFKSIKNYWYNEVKLNSVVDPMFVVVANKIDLSEMPKVNIKDGKEFADKIGAIFQSTSALSNSGISTLFDNIGKTYLLPEYDYKVDDIKTFMERRRRYSLLNLIKYINK